MSQAVAFTVLLLALYFGAAKAIIRFLPSFRNGIAFLVAVVSAYLFSITLDNLWAPLVGGLSLTILPIVAGAAYGFGFYLIARRLATRPKAVRVAFFLIGGLATLAGLVGHKHNPFVGGSLLLFGLFLPIASAEISVSASGD